MSTIVIILILLAIIVFSCNLFCILNIAFSKHLRRASHIAICSLLFAHLIQGLFVIPSYAMKRAKFGYERVICDVFRFSYLLTNYAACISLLIVTLDRLVAVVYPLRYSVKATMKKECIFYVHVGFMWFAYTPFHFLLQKPRVPVLTVQQKNGHYSC